MLGIYPLGQNQIQFGVGFTDFTALFNMDLYFIQFGANLIPKLGTWTATFSNLSSVQTFSYDPVTLSFLLEELDLSLDSALITVTGFGLTASNGGEAVTGFINQNKDLFLQALSVVLKQIFNACVSATKSIITSSSALPA